MFLKQALNIWPNSQVMSVIIWVLVLIFTLYFARKQAHKAIRAFCRVIYKALRISSQSAVLAEQRLAKRNRDVLITAGSEAIEILLEREFQRVNTVVKRDLSGFPVLQRSLMEQIKKIDEDYRDSSELPPDPPEWVEAVQTVSKIKQKENGLVTEVLVKIEEVITEHYKTAISDYRKSISIHHKTLNKLLPYWRKLSQNLEDLGKTVDGLFKRSSKIDKLIDDYERVRKNTNKAERLLKSSSITQFFISGFVLLIAIGGAVINFNLIALPMSEMVGGGSYIGSFKTSNVAALVIIFVEVAIGLYLMESLRITRLFPIIGQMDDKMRKKMIFITFGILFILASIEASLAFMRDQIAANAIALKQTLTDGAVAENATSSIPMVGQMVMGFILPFVLTFVAIPLESFVHSFRTVLGAMGTFFLRFLAYILRLFGNITVTLGEFLITVYDLMVFPLLWIESIISQKEFKPIRIGNT